MTATAATTTQRNLLSVPHLNRPTQVPIVVRCAAHPAPTQTTPVRIPTQEKNIFYEKIFSLTRCDQQRATITFREFFAQILREITPKKARAIARHAPAGPGERHLTPPLRLSLRPIKIYPKRGPRYSAARASGARGRGVTLDTPTYLYDPLRRLATVGDVICLGAL